MKGGWRPLRSSKRKDREKDNSTFQTIIFITSLGTCTSCGTQDSQVAEELGHFDDLLLERRHVRSLSHHLSKLCLELHGFLWRGRRSIQ